MPYNRRPLLTAVVLSCLGIDSLSATDLRTLLAECWSTSSAARRRFDELNQSDAAGDVATWHHARALVLTRQRRLAEARLATDEVLHAVPDAVHTRQLRIWLALLSGNANLTLAELDDLAAHWPAIRAAEPAVARDVAEWCGAVVGVLEGPLQPKTNPQQLDRVLPRFLARLAADERNQFETARQNVFRDFLNRQQQLLAVMQQDLVDMANRVADENQQLAKQVEVLNKQLEDLRQQSNDVREFYADNRRNTEAAIPRVAGAVVESNRRESWASWQVYWLASEIQRIEELIEKESDPEKRDELNRARDALVLQLQFDSWQLDRAVGDRIGSQVALGQVQNELAAIRSAETYDQQDLIRRRQQLARSLHKAERRQERLLAPDRRVTGRARSMKAALEAVSTYVAYPLEEDRARLLRQQRAQLADDPDR